MWSRCRPCTGDRREGCCGVIDSQTFEAIACVAVTAELTVRTNVLVAVAELASVTVTV